VSDPTPPPGWYPDPQRPGSNRWWNGSVWTEHVSATPAGGPGDHQIGEPGLRSLSSESRNWAAAAHLSALVAAFVALAFLGPLVVYLVKRDDPFVRDQAAEALNFNLTWGIVAPIALVLLIIVLIGLVLIPVAVVAVFAWFVLILVAASRASSGRRYRYPLTIRFVS
jgi:uncharacterized protein